MRNMSFSMTTAAFRARTKTVTRRMGWKTLRPGDRVQGVLKGMGLKLGEKVQPLGVIRVVRCTREPLERMSEYGELECAREGFPELTCAQFIQMFCQHNQCTPASYVSRIEFEYV